ncbi:MAG: hypothetical protein AAF141_04635, partial [Pseudomonadota bacterium]
LFAFLFFRAFLGEGELFFVNMAELRSPTLFASAWGRKVQGPTPARRVTGGVARWRSQTQM